MLETQSPTDAFILCSRRRNIQMQADGRILSQTDIAPDPKSQWNILKRLPLSFEQLSALFDDLEREKYLATLQPEAQQDVAVDGEPVRVDPEPERKDEA